MRLMNHINQSGNSAITAWPTRHVASLTHAKSSITIVQTAELQRLDINHSTACWPPISVRPHCLPPSRERYYWANRKLIVRSNTPTRGVTSDNPDSPQNQLFAEFPRLSGNIYCCRKVVEKFDKMILGAFYQREWKVLFFLARQPVKGEKNESQH